MEFMPFREIDNNALNALFPKPHFPEEYELGYDADGNEWVHARGVWYLCTEEQDEDINNEDQDQATFDQWVDSWPEAEFANWDSIPPPPLVLQTNEPCEAFEGWTVGIDEDDQDDQDDEDDQDEDYNLEDLD